MIIDEQEIYEGLSVTFKFEDEQPSFGDLFEIVGYQNPNFPPSGKFNFHEMEELQFSQVDDYFGVQTISDVGEDVCILLYPLIDDEIVDHHLGLFTGIRVEYNVLSNPVNRAKHYFTVVQTLQNKLKIVPSENDEVLGRKFNEIVKHWESEGIKVGSDEAMDVDY